MNRVITAAALTCLLSTSALAQKATGTGVGISESNSAAGAVAISGQGGNVNITSTTPSTTTTNINQKLSGSTRTETVASGTTTLKNVPSMVAPGLAAAGLETCLGSASGGVSAVGFGITGGSTYRDEDCTARLDARTLFSMGLKGASVARLCVRPDIWRSMPDICARYWPPGQPYPAGIAVAVPLVAPSGTYMSASIRVVDGRDGVEKDCLNYSATRQKCHQWAGEARSRTAALTPNRSVGSKPTRPKKPPAVEAIETAAPAPDNK